MPVKYGEMVPARISAIASSMRASPSATRPVSSSNRPSTCSDIARRSSFAKRSAQATASAACVSASSERPSIWSMLVSTIVTKPRSTQSG